MPFWKRDQPAGGPEPVGIDIGGILLDEEGVWRPLGEGAFEGVAWDELRAVVVESTDEGPLAGEVFVVMVGDERSGCVVPRSAMPPGFAGRLGLLPGFDRPALDRAVQAASPGRVVVWERSAG